MAHLSCVELSTASFDMGTTGSRRGSKECRDLSDSLLTLWVLDLPHVLSRNRAHFCFADLRFGRHALDLPDCVSRATDGSDHIGHLAVVDSLAQAADMNIDRPFIDVDRLAPDIVEELAARE